MTTIIHSRKIAVQQNCRHAKNNAFQWGNYLSHPVKIAHRGSHFPSADQLLKWLPCEAWVRKTQGSHFRNPMIRCKE